MLAQFGLHNKDIRKQDALKGLCGASRAKILMLSKSHTVHFKGWWAITASEKWGFHYTLRV